MKRTVWVLAGALLFAWAASEVISGGWDAKPITDVGLYGSDGRTLGLGLTTCNTQHRLATSYPEDAFAKTRTPLTDHSQSEPSDGVDVETL
jgi:hypothetical protein